MIQVLDKADFLIAYQFEEGLVYRDLPCWVQYLFDEEILYDHYGSWVYGNTKIEPGVWVIKKNNRLEIISKDKFKERFVVL